jgi:glycosyltransferase involved in cell wall biosynthesis
LLKVGIDASNLRAGGGVTHLVELLRAAEPAAYSFREVIVWGCSTTLNQLEERPWLRKVHESMLDNALPMRLYWQRIMLGRLVRQNGCDVLFVPGGSYSGSFRPFVTMSRNMLPFERNEARRFGLSWKHLKLFILHKIQKFTFRKANGLVFLTEYARDVVMQGVKQLQGKNNIIIPHGVDNRFLLSPRVQKGIGSYSVQQPFRILYVSIVDMYKHQWHVVEAVARLRQSGLNVTLQLIGAAYPPALKRLHQATSHYDHQAEFINYLGAVDYKSLPEVYHNADLFVFASSCENMPNILLEAMASGLPIACSNRGPMPEILGAAGEYFDPEKPEEIATTLQKLIDDKVLRERCAWRAYTTAQGYSWEKCAQKTFAFIADVAKESDKFDTRRIVHV